MADKSTTDSTTTDSTAADTGAKNSTATSVSKRDLLGLDITFGAGLFRGLSAIGLGLLLFVVPDKSGSMLGNKMGFFWLFSGIAMLRLNRNNPALENQGGRTPTIVAVVGIFAGLLMISRKLTENLLPETMVITFLGVIIIITGLLHIWSEFRISGVFTATHRVLNAIMGVFEIILGAMLVISPLDQSQATYWVVTIWSLVFGGLAIGEAIVQWSTARKAAKKAASGKNDVSTAAAA